MVLVPFLMEGDDNAIGAENYLQIDAKTANLGFEVEVFTLWRYSLFGEVMHLVIAVVKRVPSGLDGKRLGEPFGDRTRDPLIKSGVLAA